MYAVTNSVVRPDLLIRTWTDPRVLSADPSADFGTFVFSTKLSTERPNFGKISGSNAVMLAPVSGRASIFSFFPSMFSISTSTSSSLSGLQADAIVSEASDADAALEVDVVAFGPLHALA